MMGAEPKQCSPKVHQKITSQKESTGSFISQHHKNTAPFFPPVKASPITRPVQRKCHAYKNEEPLQRKEHASQETGLVNKVLASNGEPLDQHTQSFMSNRFGYNFADVRIHNNSIAAKSASSINARAYTSGNNIVFNEGQYSPGTSDGKKLLAHELTHVVQQKHGAVQKKIQRVSDAEFEGFHHLDEAIADGTMTPDGIMGASYPINCFLGSYELNFRFSKAYKGVRPIGPGMEQKGVYVKLEVSRHDREGPGHCTPLRLLQTVRDTQRNSSGILETAEPADETRRERSGWDDPDAPSRGWRVDTSMGTNPFYTSLTEASVEGTDTTPAILYEAPGHPGNAANGGKDFYTCAVCQTPNGSRWISGCVNWGYYIDSNRNISFLPATPVTNCAHTRTVREASQRWNSMDGNTSTEIGYGADPE